MEIFGVNALWLAMHARAVSKKAYGARLVQNTRLPT
jgi:hypothetical protein